MADVLKDRNYYRMLRDDELRRIAYDEHNELAIVLAERRKGYNPRFEPLHR